MGIGGTFSSSPLQVTVVQNKQGSPWRLPEKLSCTSTLQSDKIHSEDIVLGINLSLPPDVVKRLCNIAIISYSILQALTLTQRANFLLATYNYLHIINRFQC